MALTGHWAGAVGPYGPDMEDIGGSAPIPPPRGAIGPSARPSGPKWEFLGLAALPWAKGPFMGLRA